MPTPHTTRRKRVPKKLAAMTVAGVVLGGSAASAAPEPQRPTLDPQQVCNLHTVVSGDTMSRVAKRAGITLEDFIARNRHVANPNLIYVNDVLVINCEARTVATTTTLSTVPTTTTAPSSPPPTAPPAEVQRVVKPAPSVEWPGANPFIPGEQVVDGVASQSLILRALHNAGARGNQLVGLAAVTECESNRRLNAEGDQELRDHAWDMSLTPWQIRGAKNQQGKGTARDVDALRADPLGHGAAAAVEIYAAALAQGRDPLNPWTCHLNRHDRSFIEPYRSLAQQLGMLDGE